MGIVINYLKFYSGELLVIAAVIVLSLVPTFIANVKAFKQDPINY